MDRGFYGVRAEVKLMNDRMESMFRWTRSPALVNRLSIVAGIFLVWSRR